MNTYNLVHAVHVDQMGPILLKPMIEIALGGRKTEGTIEKISLSKLRLDPKNVRFKHLEKEVGEAAIESHIWEEEDAKTLYQQIRVSGGLIEPPVVIRMPDDSYLVKEGNRRIVCLRRLAKEAHDGKLLKEGYKYPKSHFDEVQTIVLAADLSQKDIDSLLGTRHVSGPKEWATLNRAWHIYEMYNQDDMDFDEIRQVLGFGKGTVIRMVKAFQKTIEYGKTHPEDKQWFRKFTYFDELLKKPQLRDWIEQDSLRVNTFFDWIANGKFSDVRDIRRLPQILEDPDASKVFYSSDGDISKAKAILAQKDPAISSETFSIVKKTIGALRSIPRNEFVQTARDESRLKLLNELREEIDALLADITKLKPNPQKES